MKSFALMGWVVAAALGAVVVTSGFQDSQNKFAVVDMQKVIEKSDLNTQNKATFEQMKKIREDLLVFLDTYRVASSEQIVRLKELSLKVSANAVEKAELEKIKNDIIESDKKWKSLQQKPQPTPDDATQLREFSDRANRNDVTAQRFLQEFSTEMQKWLEQQGIASNEKARSSVQQTAKAAGYTVVFDQRFAPYAANDLTEAALKSMNAK